MMESKYTHKPSPPVSTRPRCPICGTPVYSLAGIHPQCAVRQADPPRPKVKPSRAPAGGQIARPAGDPGAAGAEAAVPPPLVASRTASE